MLLHAPWRASVLLALCASSIASPTNPVNNDLKPAPVKRDPAPYAPSLVPCPDGDYVRPSNGISSQEQTYVTSRKQNADKSLEQWLARTNTGFGVPSRYPAIALASSGGGFRACLTGAGVHQAFDARDTSTSVSGLYQALTYESGLSGGSWLVGSVSGNNWPTISSLQSNLWDTTFRNGLLAPQGFLLGESFSTIVAEVASKDAAGFDVSVTDTYGRLLGYLLLEDDDDGVTDHFSGVTGLSRFQSHSVPLPFITSIGVDITTGECTPDNGATQYEFSPFEFGSWDRGVRAFTNTSLLGTSLDNGQPLNGSCINGFDSQGFVMGTSANVFNEVCLPTNATFGTSPLASLLNNLTTDVKNVGTREEYALYPNPFFAYTGSPNISAQKELTLVDGGETDQNVPVWPFLHRAVDVLIVSDNSADTNDNYPDGTAIYTTYQQAQIDGLTRMPQIPSPSTFISQGLNIRPTFFGCDQNDTMTIIYLPNHNYTFPSGQSTARLQYSKRDTDAMIANGNLVATYNNSATFPTCVGCAIMKKSGADLPDACQDCFSTFCYN